MTAGDRFREIAEGGLKRAVDGGRDRLSRVSRSLAVGLLALFAGLAVSCVDDREVFLPFPLYEDPPSGAAGFLGYSDQQEKLPVCGNCHVGQQAEWEQTAHADAWATLEGSGHSQEFCEGCHTISENGNLTADMDVGWTATADPRYQDVQCESCHGPGLEHVLNPDNNATKPIPSILVGTELTNGCGECHQGTHHGFVDEWAQSRHGDAANSPEAREREECASCHSGRGALEAWGIDAEYLEKDGSEPFGIVCAVCHDPHDPANSGQLRFPVGDPNIETNLCMKCHQRRAVPDPGSTRGPHSPQGPLLIGEGVGWQPPNFEYANTRILGTHGTEANERLCATCHLNSYEVTDAATGEFVISVKGHSFKPIPCLDEQGVPDPAAECDLDERTFASCTASGCHGTQEAARSAYIVATTRIADLVDELNALLDQVPESAFDNEDEVFTVAEGANFNAGLGEITSSAVHNPFLTEALLTASIRAVRDEYGLPAASGVTLMNLLDPEG